MSDKNLLNENTVRRFMKLANVDTMTNSFVNEMYGKSYKKNEDDLEEAAALGTRGAKGDEVVEETAEEDVVEEELDLYEQEEEDEEEPMEMDVEMGDDEAVADAPEMDDEPMMGEADISLTEEEAQLLIDLGERLKEAMGEGDSEMGMDDPGVGMDDPEVDVDEPELDAEEEDEEDEMMQEEIVNEVLKRVTQRIIREKMARK